jgi:hypothetical protein
MIQTSDEARRAYEIDHLIPDRKRVRPSLEAPWIKIFGVMTTITKRCAFGHFTAAKIDKLIAG